MYTNYITNKLLKPKQLKILKAEGYTFSKSIDDINVLKKYINRYKETKDVLSDSKQVSIDHHTLERWNERVGPIVNLDTLQNALQIIFRDCNYRIQLLDHGIGSIDNDIIFTFEMMDNVIRITTFYGRKSLQPTLNHVMDLRKYNYYSKEFVNLALTHEELNKQHFPLIPKEIIYFQGRKTSYILEKFLLTDRKFPCFVCFIKDDKYSSFNTLIIDLEKPEKVTLPNNVLYMLKKLGYGEFIISYFTCHNPEKLIKARNKALDFFSAANHDGLFFN